MVSIYTNGTWSVDPRKTLASNSCKSLTIQSDYIWTRNAHIYATMKMSVPVQINGSIQLITINSIDLTPYE